MKSEGQILSMLLTLKMNEGAINKEIQGPEVAGKKDSLRDPPEGS